MRFANHVLLRVHPITFSSFQCQIYIFIPIPIDPSLWWWLIYQLKDWWRGCNKPDAPGYVMVGRVLSSSEIWSRSFRSSCLSSNFWIKTGLNPFLGATTSAVSFVSVFAVLFSLLLVLLSVLVVVSLSESILFAFGFGFFVAVFSRLKLLQVQAERVTLSNMWSIRSDRSIFPTSEQINFPYAIRS